MPADTVFSRPIATAAFGWLLEEFCGNFSARFLMNAFLHVKESPVGDPVHSDVPKLRGAELASVYYDRRMAGDFYDFIRVGPNRVLFGLLDAAGGLRETRAIVSAAQHTFRTAGAKLFARRDTNAADAMMELCMQLNQAVLRLRTESARALHLRAAMTRAWALFATVTRAILRGCCAITRGLASFRPQACPSDFFPT